MNKQIVEAIVKQIELTRSLVLDSLELEFAEQPEKWKFVRSRLLKIFGDTGLLARVREIFKDGAEGGDGHEQKK